MNVRTCGDPALLVEVDGIDAVLGLCSALADPAPQGVTELVPAARTLLVVLTEDLPIVAQARPGQAVSFRIAR